ncbi:DMT family transporter [Kineococcus aurantiacus]|uniref:Drug/metabolite transporter (DMT)-like permease n=1 Tax=Kineococcus aurantiacus TaxID=37633 RepID=A0A7Y9AUT2_9ACTN|nr:drug/metabolite transporter (DMT)-like permease [Kineococcus aurantiacus]
MRDRRVDALLLGVAVVWGSSYLAAKVLVDVAGVLPVLALRYAGAALALGVVVAVTRARVGRQELRWGLVLGLSQAAILLLETFGVAGTSATNAGLLISTTILLTPLVEGFAARAWLPPSFFAAALVAVVGVVLLVGGGGWRTPTGGDLLVLAAAVVRACHVTAIGRVTRRVPLDLRGLTFVQTVVGAVVGVALAPGATLSVVQGATAAQWAGIAYLALGCSVFAFLAQSWAVRRTSAARASLLLGTEPLWAVVFGLALAGDALGVAGVVGAVLLLGATFAGQRVETRFSARVPVPRAGRGVAAGGARPTSDRV